MMRILFWIALLILVVAAVRSKLRGLAPKDDSARPGQAPGPDGEAMACCAHCHVYFPASEAVKAGGLDYCSPSHVRLPPR